jgi:hypothetical protein
MRRRHSTAPELVDMDDIERVAAAWVLGRTIDRAERRLLAAARIRA